jgi:hypothetical protein
MPLHLQIEAGYGLLRKTAKGGEALMDYIDAVRLVPPQDVLSYVPTRGEGITLIDLVERIERSGASRRDIMMVVQAMLDAGDLRLGPRMRLFRSPGSYQHRMRATG